MNKHFQGMKIGTPYSAFDDVFSTGVNLWTDEEILNGTQRTKRSSSNTGMTCKSPAPTPQPPYQIIIMLILHSRISQC